jgi:hypothetical protein
MGFEFLICMFLASILTGGRVATDIIHGLKGTTPPHVAKAQIKAQQASAKPKGGRSPYAAGKPRIRDVAAVYCGDAMADAIALHNKRRQQKQNASVPGSPAGEKGPSLWKQIRDLLTHPVGDPKPQAVPADAPQPEPDQVFTWPCEGCGLRFTGVPPDGRRCVSCATDHKGQAPHPARPPRPATAVPATGRSTRRSLYELGPDNCLACGNPGAVVQRPDGRTFVHNDTGERCPAIEPDPGLPETPDATRGNEGWRCGECEAVSRRGFRDTAAAAADFGRTHRPVCPGKPATPTEGDDMTDTTSSTGSATGDAHDLESASQQCDLLADDLTAIDTALDLIDEKIGSAGNATELIEAFLKSKNMPDTAVGGMSAARDMLSAGRIKALIDAIAAAKQGVRDSKEAIDGMNDQATEALQGADGSVVNGR